MLMEGQQVDGQQTDGQWRDGRVIGILLAHP